MRLSPSRSDPTLVLFRNDLRIADNRALSEAAASNGPVVAAFIMDEERGRRAPGAASNWWLHHSLEALATSLDALGVPLVLRRGTMAACVADLVRETGAGRVHWNRRYDPPGVAADTALKKALTDDGIEVESFEGALLHEPSRLTTKTGGNYKVYTPFWRALAADADFREPVPAPKALKAGKRVKGETLADFGLLPKKPDWAGGLRETWTPGEAGAAKRLRHFLHGPIDGYGEARDRPGVEATSRLSPHLAHGEITPFQIWHATTLKSVAGGRADVEKFRKELAWREFCYHLLFHNPKLATDNYDDRFDAFSWRGTPKQLKAWQQGRTGYPIVDAGMRQLWRTGWMHNRVRLVVGSFLVKHLLVDWRKGEAWFWDTLVDADPANNPGNWQWVAGSGADASPFFRIFNPVMQGQKFDPDGDYVRTFVPELARLDRRYIHSPWEAPEAALAKAGVKLGQTYPVAMVDHKKSRDRAMQTYQDMRGD